jgi:hypothetical protein
MGLYPSSRGFLTDGFIDLSSAAPQNWRQEVRLEDYL